MAAFLLIVIARIAGPSDLYAKEQPRTTSYTVDMIRNGHWALPYDTFGIPATKPPLYNWLSLPFIWLGGYREWALKAPSLLAGAATVLVILLAGRHLARRSVGETEAPSTAPLDAVPGAAVAQWAAGGVGVVAAIFWLSVQVTNKLIYIARPDMPLVALLGGAWLAATILLDRLAASDKRTFAPALAFWLCTLGAALDKGPLALFGIVYLVLAAWVLHRRPGLLARTGWWWGLPLLLLPMGYWSYTAYRQEPAFFEQVLLGRETASRVAGADRFLKTFFNGPAYVITRFLPWSLLVILALALVPPRRWFRHPMAPAILWLFIWLVIFSFASTKRPDRYAPVYPPIALLAAYAGLILLPRLRPLRPFAHLYTPARWAVPALVLAAAWCAHNQFFSDPARDGYGNHVTAFARAVRARTAGEPILFLDGEQTPLETLLGNVQPDPAPPALQASARWAIRVHAPESPGAVLISEPIDQVVGPDAGRLALYALPPGEGPSWWAQAEAIPARYVDDFNTIGPVAVARERWLQFWRLHRHPPASSPATATSPVQP